LHSQIKKRNALNILREIATSAISSIEDEHKAGKYNHWHHSTRFSDYSRIFKQSLGSYCDEMIYLSNANQIELKKIKLLIDQANNLIKSGKCLSLSHHHNYPSAPFPSIEPSEKGDHLPPKSGIYIIWNHGNPVYVGQSQNLKLRCNLQNHKKLKEKDVISFIEIPVEDLDFAECFYIGTLKPVRNFGLKARHLQSNKSTNSSTPGE